MKKKQVKYYCLLEINKKKLIEKYADVNLIREKSKEKVASKRCTRKSKICSLSADRSANFLRNCQVCKLYSIIIN